MTDADEVREVMRAEIRPPTMTLMPPAADRCQTCARKHELGQPHDANSLYWAMACEIRGLPAPTWALAMEHCSEETREAWTAQLRTHGVIV